MIGKASPVGSAVPACVARLVGDESPGAYSSRPVSPLGHRGLQEVTSAVPKLTLVVNSLVEFEKGRDRHLFAPVGAVYKGQVTGLDPARQRCVTDP